MQLNRNFRFEFLRAPYMNVSPVRVNYRMSTLKLTEEKDFLKAALQEVVQEVLEVEMEESVGARKSER